MTDTITIVGLGSGNPNQLTLEAYRALKEAEQLFVRTIDHPVIQLLEQEGIGFKSFDYLYEEKAEFEAVYEAISAELVAEAKTSPIVYAVPGHPMVAEKTVQLLREKEAQGALKLRMIGGQSFLDQVFISLGIDPVDGFQLLDGTDLRGNQLNPEVHTVIGQVYDRIVASDVKLTLMERYSDEYIVQVCHRLGFAKGEIRVEVPLYELDHVEGYGNYSLVYLPKLASSPFMGNRDFNRLRDIVRILRSPEGCPWDREQTHTSIRKHLIEEAYEVIEAIDDADPAAMCEELGDLLMQVLLHSQIAEDEGDFTLNEVIQELNDKLIRRHPHVFGDLTADNTDDALAGWDAIKAEEKAQRGEIEASVLDGIPRGLPALMAAYELQKKAAKVGFDWDEVDSAYAKIEEELLELKQATAEEQLSELGDLLFAVVNVARFLKLEPEEALSITHRKFRRRFCYIEEQLRMSGRNFDQTSLEEMDRWWDEAKKSEEKEGFYQKRTNI